MLLLEPEKLTKGKLEGKKSTVTRVFGRTQPISYLYPTKSLGGGFSNMFGCFHCNPLGGKDRISVAHIFQAGWLKPPTHSFWWFDLKKPSPKQEPQPQPPPKQQPPQQQPQSLLGWIVFVPLFSFMAGGSTVISLGDVCIESCKALRHASQQKNCWLWVSRKATRLHPGSLA